MRSVLRTTRVTRRTKNNYRPRNNLSNVRKLHCYNTLDTSSCLTPINKEIPQVVASTQFPSSIKSVITRVAEEFNGDDFLTFPPFSVSYRGVFNRLAKTEKTLNDAIRKRILSEEQNPDIIDFLDKLDQYRQGNLLMLRIKDLCLPPDDSMERLIERDYYQCLNPLFVHYALAAAFSLPDFVVRKAPGPALAKTTAFFEKGVVTTSSEIRPHNDFSIGKKPVEHAMISYLVNREDSPTYTQYVSGKDIERYIENKDPSLLEELSKEQFYYNNNHGVLVGPFRIYDPTSQTLRFNTNDLMQGLLTGSRVNKDSSSKCLFDFAKIVDEFFKQGNGIFVGQQGEAVLHRNLKLLHARGEVRVAPAAELHKTRLVSWVALEEQRKIQQDEIIKE